MSVCRIVLGFGLCSLLLGAAAGDAGGRPGASLADIEQAWQRRQDAIKSLRVRWTEVRVQPKGFFDDLPDKTRTEPSPPTDLQLPGQGTLTFDDRNCRFEIKRRAWSVTKREVLDSEAIQVYREGKNTALTTKSVVVDHPSAEIGKPKRPGDIMEFTYWPITCFARGLNPTFAPFDLGAFELSGKTQVVNGRTCVELVTKSVASKTTRTRTLLLDPGRGFVLARYYTTNGGKMTLRLDVEYAPDPLLGWIPRAWDYVATTAKGFRLESKQVRQEGWEVNPDLGPDSFTLRLPPRTRVYDTTGGDAVQYVVDDDGEPGPSVPDAARPTYKQLVELATEKRWPLSVTTTVLIGTVAVGVLTVLVWRWRRTKRSMTAA